MITVNKALSSVTIGAAPDKNCIVIDVKNENDTPVETRVTVEVGCGYEAKSLLKSKSEIVKATYALANAKSRAMGDGPRRDSNIKSWRTLGDQVPAKEVLSITLKGFKCETPPGDAEITVIREVMSQEGWKETPAFVDKLSKTLETTEPPKLCYFWVEPDYILHAGRQNVKVSFLATGYDTAFLFRNNEQIKHKEQDGKERDGWSQVKGTAIINGKETETKIIQGAIEESPSITSVYRLSLRVTPPGKKEEEREAFSRTVQVMAPGWNRISLPQGSPTRLFAVDSDFETGKSAKLYGIFYRNRYSEPENKTGLRSEAGLYSSANGVDKWDELPGTVPEGMETSPGVYYGNRLWLIGGSAADPDPDNMTKEIWCYQWNESTNTGAWKISDLQFPPAKSGLPPRFGHSCVVFDNDIWVLGGYDQNGSPRQDYWRIMKTPDKDKPFAWASETAEQAPWLPRGLHSSAVVRSGNKEILWVYGGAAQPVGGTPFFDLWYKAKGDNNWHQQLAPDAKTAIVPDPGKPLGSALVAYSDDAEGAGERLMLLGSFAEWKPDKSPSFVPLDAAKLGNRISSFHFEWQEKRSIWESKPVGDGWQQFGGENFSMQTLAFNRFIYIYTLYGDAIYPKEGTELVDLKLNIRIP
jgi:hypothetical protein